MKRLITAVSSRILGASRFEHLVGSLQGHLGSSKGEFGGPLNGSIIRRDTFAAILKDCGLRAIVETGTFRGDTCSFFADTGLPVYSAEVAPRYAAFCRARLAQRKNVHLFEGDSRRFLRTLADDPSVPKSNVFFYLDAHWSEDLPLREEVEIIFQNWTNAIILIDDFQVPGDSGYLYDDYSSGGAMTLEYLDAVAHLGYLVFFPEAPSSAEIGSKRGWTVLAREPETLDRLRKIPSLREWSRASECLQS
jgi:hypothetical protein